MIESFICSVCCVGASMCVLLRQAFAARELIASHAILHGNGQLSRRPSVQQILDCMPNSGGCNGGHALAVINWVANANVQFQTESVYPYVAQRQACQYQTHPAGYQSPFRGARFIQGGSESPWARSNKDERHIWAQLKLGQLSQHAT